ARKLLYKAPKTHCTRPLTLCHSSQTEIRTKITESIVDALEKGGLPPWRMPWASDPNGRGMPTNAATGHRYSGINPLILQLAARRHGFRSRFWATYQQWKSLNCSVMARPADVPAGAWGTTAVLFKPVSKTEIDKATGEEKERSFPLLRTFTLFNADQVHGAERWQVKDEPVNDNFIDYVPAELAISATNADIRHGGDRAFYRRPVEGVDSDFIQLPHKFLFIEEKEYYATALHELAHWSESRLNWTGSYALGELRAEIASAYLLAELGVPQSDDLSNSQSYLSWWLAALRDDPSCILRISTAASRAADHILSYSGTREAIEEPEIALVC
ncbi:MAG: ArdC family protein, partial [Acidimicrobiales bacterium]